MYTDVLNVVHGLNVRSNLIGSSDIALARGVNRNHMEYYSIGNIVINQLVHVNVWLFCS